MFFVMMLSSLCREPLAISEVKADATVGSGSEPAPETSKAQAANTPLESVKAEADVATDSVVPPDAPPLMDDLGPPASGDCDEVMVEAFEVAPRSGTKSEGGAFPLPSSAVEETTKDNSMAVVTSSLPGPRQATLECTPPYSGPLPDKLDASGHFPLAVLAEKRAKEQLADITLLGTSVEYALADAAKEIAVLKRELTLPKV